MKTTAKIALRIAVIALVVGAIGAVWIIKSASRRAETALKIETPAAPSPGASPSPAMDGPASSASGAPSIPPSPQAAIAKKPSAIIDGPLQITGPFDLKAFTSSGLPVIIDFGADSCIPCREMAPVLVDLHGSLKGKAIIRFIDVWKYRDLSQGYPLQVIPTQVFFDASGKPFTPPDMLGIPFTMYSTRDTNEHVFTIHEGGLTKDQMLSILRAMGMGR
jgi:thioredoxin 1